MRGRGNHSQGFGQRQVPTGPRRGGYNAPSGAPRGRGGYTAPPGAPRGRGGYSANSGANSGANGYNNGSAYGNAPAHAHANAENGQYRLKLDVKFYLRPQDCVDQLEIPAGTGMSRKDTTCLHCGETNIFGQGSYHLLRDGSCPRRCCRCGTMNHQGCLCDRYWLSAAFLKCACPNDGMRRPKQMRPSPLDLEVIRRDYPEYREFADSVLPLADKGHYHPSQQVPKRSRGDDDEQSEPKRSRTDAGSAEIEKMRADMDALTAENERLKTENQRLKAETERLRNTSRTSAPFVKKEEVEEDGFETLSEEFDRLVEEELARISR